MLCILAVKAPAQFWEYTGGPGGDYMYGGAMSANGELFIIAGGIHYSSDKGETWKRMPNMHTPYGSASKMICAPSGVIYLQAHNALWKTPDKGMTWTSVRLMPTYSNYTLAPNGHLIAVSMDSVWTSTDEGATWAGIKSTLTFYGSPLVADKDGILYAAVGGNYTYRSTNSGLAWQKIINGLPITSGTTIVPVRKGLTFAIQGYDLYASTDGGRVWTLRYKEEQYSAIRSIVAVNDDTMYMLNTYNRIHRSTDGGTTWAAYVENSPVPYGTGFEFFAQGNKLFILTTNVLYSYTIGEEGSWKQIIIPNGSPSDLVATSDGQVKAVTQSLSIPSSSSRLWNFNNGMWSEITKSGQNYISALSVDSNDALCAIIGSRYAKSVDGGNSWGTGGLQLSSAAFKLANTRTTTYISSSMEGVFRSSDDGDTWDQLNDGLTDQNVFSISATDNMVYAGGRQRFFTSTNQALNWQEPIFPFISGSGIVRAITSSGPNVVIGVDLTGTYFSADYGATWKNHSKGLVASDSINDLLSTPSGALFAATNTGVYEYNSSLEEWKNVNDGMLSGKILTLALGKDGRLYAGTDGDGVYRSTATYGSWFRRVSPDSYTPDDVTVFPNPATTTVQLHFKSERPNRFRTVICDLLGVVLQANDNEETLDISSLPPGHYFLRVVTDDQIRTLPLVIAR